MSFFLDETRRLRTVWRFAIFGCGFIVVQVAVGIAVAAGLAIYLVAMGASLDALMRDTRARDPWIMQLTMISSAPTMLADLGLVLLCRRFLDRRGVWSVGLAKPSGSLVGTVAVGFLIGSVPVVITTGILLAVGGLAWQGVSASIQTALLVPAMVFMAFNEEIVCRGYLLQNLIDIRRPWFGTVFTSAVFWILHALNPSAWSSPIIAVNLFLAGVVLALAYRVGGNIWFPTALHFGWNCAEGVLFEIPVSGIRTDGLLDVRLVETAPIWLTGGTFGIEGSVLLTVAEMLMTASFAIVLLRRVDEPLIAELQG
jgi:membrane protease YdiL (CAAX protease family)